MVSTDASWWNILTLKIYTTLGCIVSLILLNLEDSRGFKRIEEDSKGFKRMQEDQLNNITKSCVYLQIINSTCTSRCGRVCVVNFPWENSCPTFLVLSHHSRCWFCVRAIVATLSLYQINYPSKKWTHSSSRAITTPYLLHLSLGNKRFPHIYYPFFASVKSPAPPKRNMTTGG